jgi:hypothetical protein
MSQKTNKWVVAIIVQQDDEHHFEYTDLILGILSKPKFENIKFLIFYYIQSNKKVLIQEVIYDSSLNASILKLNDTILNVNLYNKSTLIDFLKEYVDCKDENVDCRYMVILWGHGAGLGYFKRIDKFKEVKSNSSERIIDWRFKNENILVNDILKGYAVLRANLSLPDDTKKVIRQIQNYNEDKINWKINRKIIREQLRLITANELNIILAEGLIDKQVDILYTNTCYTQLFETGYSLRKKVKLLVSPQTTIPFTGINYQSLFDQIESNPAVNLQEIAENIRDSYLLKYEDECFLSMFKKIRPEFMNSLKQVSFSCNFLEDYGSFFDEAIIPASHKLLHYVTKEDGKRDIVVSCRKKCLDLVPENQSLHGLIDLTLFFKELHNMINDEDKLFWEGVLEKINNLKNKCIWFKAVDGNMYKPDSKGRMVSPNFLSIFFPGEKSSDMQKLLISLYLKRRKMDEFQKFSEWDEFIEYFYDNEGFRFRF